MEAGFWVTSTTQARGLLRLAFGAAPHDLVVVSLGFGRDAFDATRKIVDPQVPQPVVAMTTNDDPVMLASCLLAGASHVLPRGCSREHFVRIAVSEGRHSQVVRSALSRLQARGTHASEAAGLDEERRVPLSMAADEAGCSPRETEIVALVAAGLRYQDIARHLNLSPRTVEGHAGNAYDKLGMTRIQFLERFGAVLRAVGDPEMG
jgi:DNA-binding NarL/FixJ family response regulator